MEQTSSSSAVPYRQIRALYDDKTITEYQAYNVSIATAAVKEQKLNASPDFRPRRMTWIKPSWCWMMYRSNYATKDVNQARILALKMTHANFQRLLSDAVVTDGTVSLTAEQKAQEVRVQWDPERSIRICELPYRSIQIGIKGNLRDKWVDEWVDSIEDVTNIAKGMMIEILDKKDITVEELQERGLMPVERPYNLPDDLREILAMD